MAACSSKNMMEFLELPRLSYTMHFVAGANGSFGEKIRKHELTFAKYHITIELIFSLLHHLLGRDCCSTSSILNPHLLCHHHRPHDQLVGCSSTTATTTAAMSTILSHHERQYDNIRSFYFLKGIQKYVRISCMFFKDCC